jgi:UDP-3-O-[3-hydroxymyristoyl] glucosamine N-acyltransferase
MVYWSIGPGVGVGVLVGVGVMVGVDVSVGEGVIVGADVEIGVWALVGMVVIVSEGMDEDTRLTGVVSGRSGRQALIMMTTKMIMPMKLMHFIISIS